MSATSSDYVHGNLKLIMDRFEECSPESQRMLIQSLIKEIRLFDGYVKIILSIGPTIKETLPEGLLDAKDPKEKRSTQKSEALTENTVGLRFRPNWLPGLASDCAVLWLGNRLTMRQNFKRHVKIRLLSQKLPQKEAQLQPVAC